MDVPMRKVLLAVVAVIALSGAANAVDHRIECVGVVTFWPVHDFHDPELRNGVASLKFDDHQDDGCSERFMGKNLIKILKKCHQDDRCKVIGIIGANGWLHIDHVEKVCSGGECRLNQRLPRNFLRSFKGTGRETATLASPLRAKPRSSQATAAV
jgi:hypothetical protein